MPNPAAALALSDDQKAELDTLIRNGNTPQRVALRCRLLLLAHEGVANQSIGQQLILSRPTSLALRNAVAHDGIAAVTGFCKRQRQSMSLTPGLEQEVHAHPVKSRAADSSTA